MEDPQALIHTLAEPTLLMQTEPRLVVTANRKACELFGKDLAQIKGQRGGQVFNCVHSFSEDGCGKDANCQNCPIKEAVVGTFETGNSCSGVRAVLDIKKQDTVSPYEIQVGAKKVGEFAFITIEKYTQQC